MKKLILILLTTICTTALANAMGGHQHGNGDAPSVHGMLMFGQQELFISHLPMFHTPHDYQAIASVELSEKNKSIYLNSKSNNPLESVYTIVPEIFVLPEVFVEGATFKAQVFKGHFERGGQPISEMIEFKIKEVIFFKKLNGNASSTTDLKYIYFGTSSEMFAAHIVNAKPDFDQIIEIKVSKELTKFLFGKGFVELKFKNLKYEPLLVGNTGIVGVKEIKELDNIEVLDVLYTEFNDLSF